MEIENRYFREIEDGISEEYKRFFHSLNNFRRDYMDIRHDVEMFARRGGNIKVLIDSVVKIGFDIQTLLLNYLMLIKKSAMIHGEANSEHMEKLEDDISDYRTYLTIEIKNLKDNTPYVALSFLTRMIKNGFDGFIGPYLVEAYENKGDFLENLYPSTKSMGLNFRKELLMSALGRTNMNMGATSKDFSKLTKVIDKKIPNPNEEEPNRIFPLSIDMLDEELDDDEINEGEI